MGNHKEEDPVRLVHVSTAMAAVALGAATALYMKVEQLEKDRGSPRAAPREGARVTETALDGGQGPIAMRRGGGEREPGLGAVEAADDASAGVGAARDSPASIEERIARLERDQKALRPGHGMPWRPSQTFARNVDDLARHLSLTSTQRTRIEDVIARGRQRIEDVLKIPDETGKSPYERRAEARKKIEEAMKNPQPGGLLAFATDLVSSRDRKIPGRNDTYADEIDRVRKETREEISSALDAKQRESFEQTNVDGLLGEAGQMSFTYAVGDVGADGQGEMMVEMGADIVTDAHEMPADETPPPPEAPASGER